MLMDNSLLNETLINLPDGISALTRRLLKLLLVLFFCMDEFILKFPFDLVLEVFSKVEFEFELDVFNRFLELDL